MSLFTVALCISAIASSSAFLSGKPWRSELMARGQSMVATTETPITSIQAPDFYWQFRLNRLISKKGDELPFKAENYKDSHGFRNLYDAYYLDLTLHGKLDGFDWRAEKKITEGEWLEIYKDIANWTTATAENNKPSTSNLPADDFDLLKQIYPQVNLRDLDIAFAVEEVGDNFPYRNMKDMIKAAMDGTLNVPGYTKGTVVLEASEARKQLASLKESSMKRIEALRADAIAFASAPFPDEEAKAHYKALRAKLSAFPQSPAEWSSYRANMDKEVDEMARLASKPIDPHHHHDEDHHEETLTPAQEFEAKYGRNLDEMASRMAKLKSNPVDFLETSIMDKHGKSGLDVWKRAQEVSVKMSVMSDKDKAMAEAAFADFLKQA